MTADEKAAKRKAYKAAWQKNWRAANPEKARQWFVDNPDKYAAAQERYKASAIAVEKRLTRQRANRPVFYARTAKWREQNAEAVKAARKAHKQAKPHMHCAAQQRREAAKKQAIPAWTEMQAIREVYALAAFMTASSGIAHHVDHIVPLKSKLVCGLHCAANLRVISATENIVKGNRTWPNMPIAI